MIAFAPDGNGLHPVRPVLRGILLVKKFFIHAVGIALARERTPSQMRQNRRRNPDVVVDDLLLGKPSGGIQNLFQIRQLELLALNLNTRIHCACSSRHCASNRAPRQIPASTCTVAGLNVLGGLTTSLPST